MRVFRSADDEQALVHDEDDDFVASFAYGEWIDRKIVDIERMIEIDVEEEFYDALRILTQAKKALRVAF
jgi:hypothetical protein